MVFSQIRGILAILLFIPLAVFIISGKANGADSSASDDIVLKTPEASQTAADSGIVLETMDAADYTYIKVKTDEDSVWVAMPATKVKKGIRIHYALGMVVRNFKSKSLGRTFAEVIFSPGLISDTSTTVVQAQEPVVTTGTSSFSEAVKKEVQQQNPVHPETQQSAGSAGATVPLIEDAITPASGENSYTVGQIFAKAKQLDGKTVQVRGKVVKVNLNIMGKNWIHIQDGTGNPMENSHDLVVTSSFAPELDQIVVIEGNVAANKDFGYGYKYDALIEEATVTE
jgi:hypothetical protein